MQEPKEYIKNEVEFKIFPPLENFITWYKISDDQMTVEREIIPIKDPLFKKIYDGIENLRIFQRKNGIKVSDLELYQLEKLKEKLSYNNRIHGETIFNEIDDTVVVTFESLYYRAQAFLSSLTDQKWPGYPYIGANYGNDHQKEQYIYNELEEKLQTFNEVKSYFKNLPHLNDSYEIQELNIHNDLGCLEFEILYDKRLLANCSVRFGSTGFIRFVDSELSMGKYWMTIYREWTETPPSRKVHGVRISNRLTGKNDIIPLEEMEKIFNNVFLPQIDENVFNQIHNAFETVYGVDLGREDIRWDPVRCCYHLTPNKESSLFQYFIPQHTKKKAICKYTTLTTLVQIIKSKQIRMNGILAMNDKSEYQYLKKYSKNFKNEEDEEFYYLGNKKFITSFSKKIDNLGMWRLYGQELEGICMVFEVNNTLVKDIIYIPDKNKEVKKVKRLLSVLKRNNDIHFRICIIDNNQAFYKSDEYQHEDESRLLINSEKPDGWQVYSNNLLTPYIQPSIYHQLNNAEEGKDSKYDKPYGLILKKILVGPNMPNREYNYNQIKQLLREHKMYGVEVECSIKHKFR